MLTPEFALLRKARSRSVSPENVYGEKGPGGMAEATPEPHAPFPALRDKDAREVI